MPRLRRYPAPILKYATSKGPFAARGHGWLCVTYTGGVVAGLGQSPKEACEDWRRAYEIANGPIPSGNYTQVLDQWYRPHKMEELPFDGVARRYTRKVS